MSRKRKTPAPRRAGTAMKAATASLRAIKRINPAGFLALARLIDEVEKNSTERAA